MQNLSFHLYLSLATALAIAAVGTFLGLARLGFRRAWGEFRLLQEERVQRAAGILSPALASARPDPFDHLPEGLLAVADLRFERVVRRRDVPLSPGTCPLADPLLEALLDWEHHHHSASESFMQALGHVAHHRLVPQAGIEGRVDPIGMTLQRLIEQCPDPSLGKELRLAYEGLRTGAEQNFEYVSRKLRASALRTKTEFHATLGSAHSELGRFRDDLISSICRDASREIQSFLDHHRGFRLNPLEWGRQAAYFREFEQLSERLEQARVSNNLSQVVLIVVMIAEDEKEFVNHLHQASRLRDEIHRQLSKKLQASTQQLSTETDSLTGWIGQENQRLQNTVSLQIIQQLQTHREGSAHSTLIATWIEELSQLHGQEQPICIRAG